MIDAKPILAVFFAGALINMGVAGSDLLNWVGLIAVPVGFRLLQLSDAAPLHPLEPIMIAAAALIIALPVASPGRLAAGAVGMLILMRRTDPRLRGALVIFIAVLVRDPLAKAALDITSDTVLALDAALADGFLGLIGMETVRIGNIITTGSHDLLVMSGCSSVTNLSWALLLWIVATRATVPITARRHWIGAAGVTVAVILINGIRLALLGTSHAFHVWAHGPQGTALFEAATMMAAALVIFWSLRHDTRNQGLFSLALGSFAQRRRLETL